MRNRIRPFKFPLMVMFVVGTVWFTAWERSLTAQAAQGYIPAPKRLVKHGPVHDAVPLFASGDDSSAIDADR